MIEALKPCPLDDWHEHNGAVLWWRFPIEEPPYIGHPNCDDWPGYHTHWTPLVIPHDPAEACPTPATGWTGDGDADLAIILLGRLDVLDDGCRIEQLEQIVRRLAARAALAQAEAPAVTECADNDSPWLVCKPCAAAGKCANSAARVAEDPGAVYKRGYEEALNDCLRNGLTWARSMFANNAEHIKQADAPADELERIAAFLDGSAPLDGVWFGERHPTLNGAFWWRPRLTAAVRAARAASAPAQSNDDRAELVVAVHTLASHYENALGAFGDDEGKRKAEGDIAHAMKIAAKYNWNGRAASAPAAPGLTEEHINAVVRSVQPNLGIGCKAWRELAADCRYWLESERAMLAAAPKEPQP